MDLRSTFLILFVACASVYYCNAQIHLIEAMRSFLRDSRNQLINEPADTRDIDPAYDFIIVGAGTAGCALAARLSELKDNTVLLIEAGGPEEFMMDIPMMAPNLQGTPADWAYMSEPDGRCCTGQPGGRCFYPRGKVMGGSSVLNFMIYSRGHKRDYDRWAEAGCKGWSYKEVLPYFKKLENFKIDEYFDPEENGKGGPVHVELSPYETPIAKEISKGFLNLGYKYGSVNKADNKGFSRMPATLKHGTRHSSSRAYLHPIANKRPNLHVKKNSLVTKILINKKTKTAYGVQFLNNGITRQVLARKEVIVSGGAMNSPQLLMLSGIGPAHHLRSLGIPVIQNSSVGYNLQDHIALGGLIFVTEGSSTTTPLDLIRNDTIITEYFNHHTGPLSVPGGCEVIGLIDPDKDGIPKVELLVVSQQIMMNFFLNTPIAAFLEPYLATSIWLCLPMVLKPYSRGRIKLKSKNPLDYPLIEPNYFADERDLATMIQAGRRMLEINDSPVMKKIKSRLLRLPLPACEPFPIRSDEYLACLSREMTFNIYHQSGTCRMGPASDPTSVVDPRLRVIGVKNLRVIDVSIMHEIPSGHTNGPTYMVAEKGADMIKEDWGYPIPRNGNWAYNPIDEHKT